MGELRQMKEDTKYLKIQFFTTLGAVAIIPIKLQFIN